MTRNTPFLLVAAISAVFLFVCCSSTPEGEPALATAGWESAGSEPAELTPLQPAGHSAAGPNAAELEALRRANENLMGKVAGLIASDDETVFIRWDSITLREMGLGLIIRCENGNLDWRVMTLDIDDIDVTMAVLPERQRQGIGSMMVQAGIDAMWQRSYPSSSFSATRSTIRVSDSYRLHTTVSRVSGTGFQTRLSWH